MNGHIAAAAKQYAGRSSHTESMFDRNGSAEKFTNPFGACNFIVTWDGEDVRELFEAIRCARKSTDRFIQDKLIEYILNIPFRNPRPTDIPAFAGKPVWAVDRHGHALIGMPGSELVVDVETLRKSPSANGHSNNGHNNNGHNSNAHNSNGQSSNGHADASPNG